MPRIQFSFSFVTGTLKGRLTVCVFVLLHFGSYKHCERYI